MTPLPGERFDVGGDEYKWTRCVSDNGFIMDFNEMFHSVNNGVAYATAMLYSDKEQIVQVLYGGSGENLIYCNDIRRKRMSLWQINTNYLFI